MNHTSARPALLCGLVLSLVGLAESPAQDGGDQILDGIGETAMVARYVFDGDTLDSSRNALHASLEGTGAGFVEDNLFGPVLALPGGEASFVRIPGRILEGSDSITVCGWFKMGAAPGRVLFDFGQQNGARLVCSTDSEDDRPSCRYRLSREGATPDQAAVVSSFPAQEWVHLAVVVDAARRSMRCYTNGVKAGALADMDLTLEPALSDENKSDSWALLGRGHEANEPGPKASIHDFRVYGIALTDEQVGGIHRNALQPDNTDTAVTDSRRSPAQTASHGIAQPMASLLVGVADVSVETTIGQLPRLPSFLDGSYPDGVAGPRVRVVWPAPTDAHQVHTAGVYRVTGAVPGTTLHAVATVTVREDGHSDAPPRRQLEPFPLGAVRLDRDTQGRETPFMKNRDKFLRGLAATDPDRFLYMFRDAFGQPQPEGVEPLHGWDSRTTRLRGHATGHYLSAIAQAYASTAYDETLQADFGDKMDYLIDTLYNLSLKSGAPTNAGAPFNPDPTAVPPGPGKTGYDSDLSAEGIRTDYWNWGVGFISAYPPDQFILLEQGATYGGGNDQIWAPYYTLHKILAGLLDCYEVGGNEKALAIAEGMALWVQARLAELPVETRIRMWNRYIAGEYGGMNEVLARLSRVTGNEDFLDCARLFDNTEFFFGDTQHTGGLVCNVDTIRGRHANQHIPQIIGALETYRLSGDPDYWWVAENFWDMCTHSYLYSIGGVAGARNPNNAECFTCEPDTLFANGFAEGGQNETCATYNLLKLTRQLFFNDPEGYYMDYYEQALYNHILASVAEEDPGNTYHVPLNPAARKRFGNARMDGFTCCNGTALESNTKLQDSIYFKSTDNGALYVNLYIPSRLRWSERDVTLTQTTDFPYGDTTTLAIAGGGTFDLNVRVPRWATRGFFVRINGGAQPVDAEPGTYLTLPRNWQDGDTVELRMPFGFRLSPVMDQPNIASLFYGPVLLAAEESEPRSAWRPITLNDPEVGASIAGDPATLRFEKDGIRFKPFFETYDRCSVYLDVTME